MIEETYYAFRSAGVPEDKAIQSTIALAENTYISTAKLELIKWLLVGIALLTAAVAIKVFFFLPAAPAGGG